MATIEDIFARGVQQIADELQVSVLQANNKRGCAFITSSGLCVMGIIWVDPELASADIRWRVFIGELTPSFDFLGPMRANHDNPDTPYGIVTIDGKSILTISDTFTFAFSLGLETIQRGIFLRWGGAFDAPFLTKGTLPLSQDFVSALLKNKSIPALLSS